MSFRSQSYHSNNWAAEEALLPDETLYYEVERLLANSSAEFRPGSPAHLRGQLATEEIDMIPVEGFHNSYRVVN